jgi:phosphate transport system substrate-binding protein
MLATESQFLMKRFLPQISLALVVTALVACGRPEASTRNVIQNKGSDTLVNVAQAWAERYSKGESGTMIAVSGGGSGTGISAMINGTVDIANASRKMKDKEVAAARKNGIDPIEHVVGFDALAVYVHKDNPVESLTLEQLARIYGEHGDVTRWSQIGVKMEGKNDKIIRVSRQNNSGTYVYFKETVLGKTGEYKLGTLDMHGSKDVVDLCDKTPGAIGYSGLAYATDHVKLVPVVNKTGKAVLPSIESAVNGEYPIARPLFMYTSGQPQGAIKQYLDWILSSEGQQILHDKGYAPVNTAIL